MKRFLAKVIIYIAVIAALDIVFCAVIDPFNVMHASRIRDNGVEPNKNYIKMSYIIDNPDKFDSYMFGSSRVGSIHVEKIADERCYNMTYSGGVPAEHLDNIITLLNAGIVPKKIYIGVDSLSYTEDPALHLTQGLRCPYERLVRDRVEFFKLYFDPAVVASSIVKVIKGHTGDAGYAERFYSFGWDTDYERETKYDFNNAAPDIGASMLLEETLEQIAEISSICKKNNVELVVFTNPMYSVTYEASLEKDYLTFLEKLAHITPYYNFSGCNEITANSANYIDSSHYTAEVGDMLIERMSGGVCCDELLDEGFGIYVTEDNVDELLTILTNQIRDD